MYSTLCLILQKNNRQDNQKLLYFEGLGQCKAGLNFIENL